MKDWCQSEERKTINIWGFVFRRKMDFNIPLNIDLGGFGESGEW
jgi:hypothetical protein